MLYEVITGREGYRIEAYVEDASGLEKHTHVLMNGVTIGDVDNITIEGKKVRLTLLIDKGIDIPNDSSVIVAQESLLGSKVFRITSYNVCYTKLLRSESLPV